MTFLIFQHNLNVCPLTLPPVTQDCLTVDKCVLMTATFSGVYFKESASTMSSAALNSRHCAPSVCTNWFPEGAFNEPRDASCSVLPSACFYTVLETAEPLQVAHTGPCPRNKVFGSCLPPNSCYECLIICLCSHRDCVLYYCVSVFRHLCAVAQTQLVPMKRYMIKTTDKQI